MTLRRVLWTMSLLSLNLLACAGAQPRKPASDPTDFQRFEELESGVFRGSYVDSEADFTFLQSKGVRSLVSLRGMPFDVAAERKAAVLHGLQFFNTPMEALPIQPGEKQVNAALDDIGNPVNQPVFFHCKLGRDRTGMVAALYRVIYQGTSWSPSEAHAEWEKFGYTEPFLFSGLERYFNRHLDPNVYWRRNPTLVGLSGFTPATSCLDYANSHGSQEVFCSVEGAAISAVTLIRAVSPGGRGQAGTALSSPAATPNTSSVWSYCEQMGGHSEDIRGDAGSHTDICRFADGTAVENAALVPSSPLAAKISSWRQR